MEECDTLFMIGTSFPYIEFLPKPGQARGVQIDINPTRVGLRYPVEVGLAGDSRLTLQKLLPLLRRNEDRSFLTKAQESVREWWKLMEERGTRQDKPMNPQVVAWELGKRLAPDAIVSADSGTTATWFARPRWSSSAILNMAATYSRLIFPPLRARAAAPDIPSKIPRTVAEFWTRRSQLRDLSLSRPWSIRWFLRCRRKSLWIRPRSSPSRLLAASPTAPRSLGRFSPTRCGNLFKRMEYWNIGVVGSVRNSHSPALHYSTIPTAQFFIWQ